MDQDDLRYSDEHLWVRIDDDRWLTVGISEAAFQEDEEVIGLRLPAEGDEVVKDELMGRLTTDKPGVIRLYAPVSGQIVEVNDDLVESPEMVLEDPYAEGWLVRIEIDNLSEYEELMTREEYEEVLGDESAFDDDDDDLIEDDDDDEDDY